jgi:large subunit ribosomal protein L18
MIKLSVHSHLLKSIRPKVKKKLDIAKLVGEKIAEMAIEKGVKEVKFDKGPYKYHGRLKVLADAAREKGLSF